MCVIEKQYTEPKRYYAERQKQNEETTCHSQWNAECQKLRTLVAGEEDQQ